MNKPPQIQESAYYVHQRYEDTAQIIFQQQQKKKKDLKHGHPDGESNEVEFAHYGNPGVIARKEAAARLASYNKEGKSLKKEDKGAKKEEKSSKKEEKSSKRRDSGSSAKGDHIGKEHLFTERYTPLDSPRIGRNIGRKVLSPHSLNEASLSSDNDVNPGSPNSSDLTQYTLPYSPDSTNVTSTSETFSLSPQETTFGTEEGSVVQSPIETSLDSDHEDLPQSPNGRHVDFEKESSPGLESEDSFVDFAHYGNTGVIAKKEAVARIASILRKDRDTQESKICSVM